MRRPTNESHLISSLISAQDVEAAAGCGITPEMFDTCQAEYRWVLSHKKIYGGAPTREALAHKFPDFPLTESADVAFFSDEVRQDYTKRELVKTIQDAAHKVYEGDLEEALITWASFNPPMGGTRLVSSYADSDFLSDYGEAFDTMRVPWKTLYNITGGIRPGDYWTLAARTSQGKSWYLLEMIADALLDGRTLMLYSMEMSEKQSLVRLHVILGQRLGIKVDHKDMRDHLFPKRDYEHLLGQIKERVPGSLYIHDSSKSRVSPALIASNSKSVDASYVDYIGLMSTSSGQSAIKDWRIAAEISNNLKEIAVSTDGRIIVAAQINREGASSREAPPDVSQISQTDSIGQDSDVVVTMKQYSKTTMVLSPEKNRHGPAKVRFYTNFQPNVGDFREISRVQAESIQAMED